jgi:hypothetical protein
LCRNKPQKVWWPKQKNTNVLCRVSAGDTRQSMLCRVPPGWHSAKKCKLIFAECHLVDTRQRSLCRVSPIWHSAKLILKIKKNLCRVPDRGHSAKKENKLRARLLSSSFSPLTLSVSAQCAAAPPCPAPPPPCRARPRLPAQAAPARARRGRLRPPRAAGSPCHRERRSPRRPTAVLPSATVSPARHLLKVYFY